MFLLACCVSLPTDGAAPIYSPRTIPQSDSRMWLACVPSRDPSRNRAASRTAHVLPVDTRQCVLWSDSSRRLAHFHPAYVIGVCFPNNGSPSHAHGIVLSQIAYTLFGYVPVFHSRNNDLENRRVVCVSTAARITVNVDNHHAFVRSHGRFVAGWHECSAHRRSALSMLLLTQPFVKSHPQGQLSLFADQLWDRYAYVRCHHLDT